MITTLDAFLEAFYPNPSEPIHFRAFKPKGAPTIIENNPRAVRLSRSHLVPMSGEKILRELNHLRGIYFCPNAGGMKDHEICRFNAVFVENDNLTIARQHELLDESPLQTSIRVETEKSVHAYWLLSSNCAETDWRLVQKGLIDRFSGDKVIKNPSRLMRLPFFLHLKYNENIVSKYEAKRVEVVQFDSTRRYSIEDLKQTFPAPVETPLLHGEEVNMIGKGSRNSTLFSHGCQLRRKGLCENDIFNALIEMNEAHADPPLENDEIRQITRNVLRYGTVNQLDVRNESCELDEMESIAIPQLPAEVLFGLAGDVVRTIEPHTEADNAAILVQLLVGYGNLIGQSAHFKVEADHHFTKLNAVLVGASSKGRKGTSWGQVRNLLCKVDSSFADCIHDGIASGEGLIFHVSSESDELGSDKRALIVEPEFARVLKSMKRDGNTISSVIRQAWDTDRLQVMRAKNPLRVSGAHISIVGHITSHELIRNLEETETANGFANRFLWVYTRRSKYLPEGGSVPADSVNELVRRLHLAAAFARDVGEVGMDHDARAVWFEIYPELSDGHPGQLGAVTSRAEAQVKRIACIYSLLDCSEVITIGHLNAALALWKYCEESAKYVFGYSTGDRIADCIWAAIKETPNGLTGTQIRDIFQRNESGPRVKAGLRLLIDMGRIESEKKETGGRKATIFKKRIDDKYDKND